MGGALAVSSFAMKGLLRLAALTVDSAQGFPFWRAT
jgi:hypothetical protein